MAGSDEDREERRRAKTARSLYIMLIRELVGSRHRTGYSGSRRRGPGDILLLTVSSDQHRLLKRVIDDFSESRDGVFRTVGVKFANVKERTGRDRGTSQLRSFDVRLSRALARRVVGVLVDEKTARAPLPAKPRPPRAEDDDGPYAAPDDFMSEDFDDA